MIRLLHDGFPFVTRKPSHLQWPSSGGANHYAKITSERDSRARNKGGNEFLEIELSAFGKIIGHVVLEINDDADNQPMQYLLKFAASLDADEWVILKEGHQKEGVIQTIKA